MDLPTLVSFLSLFELGKKPGSETLGDIATVLAGASTSNGNSIKYRAKNLIAQYPILYSDNVSSSTVQLVNRALEHEYVNLLRLLIQNVGATNDFSSTEKFLGGFHKNIYNDRNLDSGLSMIADDSNKNESILQTAFKEANKELLVPFIEDLNQRSLNEETITKEHRLMLEDDKDVTPPVTPPADKDKDKKKDSVESAVAKIDKVDINKANELTPTSVTADITYVKDGNKVEKTINFGVKCVAHLLNSSDIEKYLPTSVITKTPIMRAIQWTTGEIKFFKDFLLNIDEIKDMANKNNDRDNFWWRKLQELSRVSKMHPLLKKFAGENKDGKGRLAQSPIPTATMVVTKENVDNIKHRYGIDILNKPSFAYKIMSNYFLMTFIVVDESIETLYMYNEETRNFSAYSFKSLETYSKQKNMDIKDLYNFFK